MWPFDGPTFKTRYKVIISSECANRGYQQGRATHTEGFATNHGTEICGREQSFVFLRIFAMGNNACNLCVVASAHSLESAKSKQQ